jgi:hypothetical protein
VVLARKLLSLVRVLCCFVWVWCFIMQVLCVHFCNFNVVVMFLFFGDLHGFYVFSTLQLLLHYRCFYIATILTFQFFNGMDLFVFLCNIYR